MEGIITFVGMDAHKNSIYVAMLLPGSEQPIVWEVANTDESIRRLARKLKREAKGKIRCCYEAGPCGYALQRQLWQEGIECVVVAPSKIPRMPGDRVKTDRRDARKLAELFKAGLLTRRDLRPQQRAMIEVEGLQGLAVKTGFEKRIALMEATERAFRFWHHLHLPLLVVLVLTVLVHLVAVLLF